MLSVLWTSGQAWNLSISLESDVQDSAFDTGDLKNTNGSYNQKQTKKGQQIINVIKNMNYSYIDLTYFKENVYASTLWKI